MRQRGHWYFFQPDPTQPPTGEIGARCDTCDIEGTIDVAFVVSGAVPGRPTLKVRIRLVYGV